MIDRSAPVSLLVPISRVFVLFSIFAFRIRVFSPCVFSSLAFITFGGQQLAAVFSPCVFSSLAFSPPEHSTIRGATRPHGGHPSATRRCSATAVGSRSSLAMITVVLSQGAVLRAPQSAAAAEVSWVALCGDAVARARSLRRWWLPPPGIIGPAVGTSARGWGGRVRITALGWANRVGLRSRPTGS